MTFEEAFEQAKNKIIGSDIIIKSASDADSLHQKLLKLRTHLALDLGIMHMMPHYRGEQYYGWDIRPGIFRPPLNISDGKTAKYLEIKAIQEFENVIVQNLGAATFRNIFNIEKHGRDWDLLFQAQHAGIKTTLTDWSAEIISALYFATEESFIDSIEKADGQLWCFMVPEQNIIGHNNSINRRTFYDIDPFNMTRTYLINPSSYLDDIENRIFEYRMYKQKGRFIMSSNNTCQIPLNLQDELKPYIFKVQIPSQHKQQIRDDLAKRHVVRKEMYIDENPSRQDLISEINKKIFAGH